MSHRLPPWTTWLGEHGPGLILFARQWSDCHADAEDIVQEAFVHFWAKRDGVRDPLPYLYACVRRAAVDWLRKKDRRQEQWTAGPSPAGEPWFEPVSCCAEEERRAKVEEGIATLPPDQRQVVVMKIWGELTFAAIGEVLSISTNTAASRYRRALATLHKQLREVVIE